MQIRTDLEYQLLFLLSFPLGNAFLLSLAEGKVISDVGVYLGNENRDKTTSYIGQSVAAMTSFLHLSQTSTLQSLCILNNFKAEGRLPPVSYLLHPSGPSPTLNWCLPECAWALLELRLSLNNHRARAQGQCSHHSSFRNVRLAPNWLSLYPEWKGQAPAKKDLQQDHPSSWADQVSSMVTLLSRSIGACSSFLTRLLWGLFSSLLPFWRTFQSFSVSSLTVYQIIYLKLKMNVLAFNNIMSPPSLWQGSLHLQVILW